MSIDPKIRAFDVCLRRMQAGDILEEALALFPQWADELRPLLKTAQIARNYGKEIQIPADAQARSRAKFLETAGRRARARPAFSMFASPLRFSLAALILLILLFAGAASTVAVSAQALPGDALYPVKLATERTRLLLTENQARRLELEQSFDQERVSEVEALIQHSRSQPVNFAGGLTQMGPGGWIVDGIHVDVPEDAQIIGEIKTGYYVDIQGILQPDGVVVAQKIQARTFEITGRLQEMLPDRWVVSDVPFATNSDTRFQGTPEIGSQVHVTAVLLLDQTLLARLVEVTSLAPAASPTPAPSNTVTNVPTNTFQPDQTPTPAEKIEPEETQRSTETGEQEDTRTPESTELHEASRTPEPTEIDNHDHTPEPTRAEEGYTPEPTRTIQGPTATPKPTEHDDDHAATPYSTYAAQPSPTQTPESTKSPDPTHTPEPTGEND